MGYKINAVYAYEILSMLRPPKGREVIGQIASGHGIYFDRVITAQDVADAWDTMLEIAQDFFAMRQRRSSDPRPREYVDLVNVEHLLHVRGMMAAEQAISIMPPADFDTLWDDIHAERRRQKERTKEKRA